MVRPAQLMVSGTYRSGTTYVERLLDNTTGACCAPQPFPYLYLAAKRRFLEAKGVAVPPYLIGTGFHDPVHLPAEMADVLRSEILDRDFIRETFRSMHGYSGAQTPDLDHIIDRIPDGNLGAVVCSMHELLADRRRPLATVLASKEAFLEEFIPAFGDAGIKVLLVVRDPRAIAASTLGPASATWTGMPRPLLYTIRLWRKSVAYALRFRDTVAHVRFEDVVADAAGTLRAGLRSLGIELEIDARDPLLDVRGHTWHRNTSFPDETPSARAQFGLSEPQLAYIEALARPEMLALGYEPVSERSSFEAALGAFGAADDPGRDHPAFEPDYSVDPMQLELERARLRHLNDAGDPIDEARWFVLPGVRGQLA